MVDRRLRFVPLLLICCSDRLSALQYTAKRHDNVRPHNVVNLPVNPLSLGGQRSPKRKRALVFVYHSNKSENEPEIIYVDEVINNNNNELPNDVLEEMRAGQPSELIIMKDVRHRSKSYIDTLMSLLF